MVLHAAPLFYPPSHMTLPRSFSPWPGVINPEAIHHPLLVQQGTWTVPSPPMMQPNQSLNHLLLAGLILLTGLLTHQLPRRNMAKFNVLPGELSDYLRVLLGVGVVSQLNKAVDWKPNATLGALEAVTVISLIVTPLLSKKGAKFAFNKMSIAQFAVIAPVAILAVNLANLINKYVDKPLEKNTAIPPEVTRLVVSVLLALLSTLSLPKLFQLLAEKKFFWKEVCQEILDHAKKGRGFWTFFTFTCSRMCCPGVVCISELSEMALAFRNRHLNQSSQPSSPFHQSQPVRA